MVEPNDQYPNILLRDLSIINTPVLLVAVEKDEILEEYMRKLSGMIMNSELEIIPNSSHNVAYDQSEILNNYY